MIKARKGLIIASVILFIVAVVVFVTVPILVQILFSQGFLHVDALLLSVVFNIKDIALGFLSNDIYSYIFLGVSVFIFMIFIFWIVVAGIKKNHSAGAIIFGMITLIGCLFMACIFVFDTGEVIKPDKSIEFNRNGYPLVAYLLSGGSAERSFDPLFAYSLLGVAGVIALCFLFVIIAFIVDCCAKKGIADEDEEELDEDAIRKILREELSSIKSSGDEKQQEAAAEAVVASAIASKEETKPVEEQPKEEATPNEQSYFDGRFWGLLGKTIVYYFLIIVSFGVMYPISLHKMRKWEIEHTVINGRRLVYKGILGELYGKWMLWWFLSIITFGIYAWFVPVRFEKYIVSHTDIEGGDQIQSEFTGTHGSYFGMHILGAAITVCSLGLLTPVVKVMLIKWRARNTIYNGEHITFNGKGGKLFGKYILWALLTVVTLTIFAWFIPIKTKKWIGARLALVDGGKKLSSLSSLEESVPLIEAPKEETSDTSAINPEPIIVESNNSLDAYAVVSPTSNKEEIIEEEAKPIEEK